MNFLKESILKYKNKDLSELVYISANIAESIQPITKNNKYKYSYIDIFSNIYDFLICGTTFSNYRSQCKNPIKGKYLNELHNKLCRLNIFEQINKTITLKYLEKDTKKNYNIYVSFFLRIFKTKKVQLDNLLSIKTKTKNAAIDLHNKKLNYNNKRKSKEHINTFNRYNGRKKYFKMSVVPEEE